MYNPNLPKYTNPILKDIIDVHVPNAVINIPSTYLFNLTSFMK